MEKTCKTCINLCNKRGEVEQLNLFNYIKNKNVNEMLKDIKPKLRKYGIDKLFERKFCDDYIYTFYEISKTLNNTPTYKDYLNTLYNEISRYIPVGQVDVCKNYGEVGCVEFKGDCLYLSMHNIAGPIYSLKMLKDRLQEVKEGMND